MLRRLKYTLVADMCDAAIRYTPLFDAPDGPPDLINFAGGGDYRQVGDNTVALIERETGLAPGDRVLDIGCAIGRNALALHRRHGEAIAYAGFDIVPFGIRWCRRWARRHAASFRFDHADIANSFYNPRGTLSPAEYRFPYEDDSMDLSISTSVYTHMMRREVVHYLKETARVTAPGGRLYATAFVLDAGARDALGQGRAAFRFEHVFEGSRVEEAGAPSVAVGLDPEVFSETLGEAGARSVEIRPGSWRGGAGTDFQDIVVARF